MGFANNILTAPFTKIALNGGTYGDLQKALGRTTCMSEIQLVGDLMSDGQGGWEDAGAIKVFAKHKPFRDTTQVFAFDPTKATPELRSPARWQAAKGQRYGLNPAPLLSRNPSTGVFNHAVWTYNKPTLPTYPLRALDFDGYYSEAVSPIYTNGPGPIWYAGSPVYFQFVLDPVGFRTHFNTENCITNEDALGEQYHKKTSPGWYVSLVVYANQGNSGNVVETVSSGKTPKELIENEGGKWNLEWVIPINYVGRTLTFQLCLANLPTAGSYTVDDYDPFSTGNAYSLEYALNDGRYIVSVQQNPGGVAALFNLRINSFSLYDTQNTSPQYETWMFDSGITLNIGATNNWDNSRPLDVYATISVENGSINETDLSNPVTSVALEGISLTIPADNAQHTYTLASASDLQRAYQIYIPEGETAYVRVDAYGIDFQGNRIDFPTQIYTLNP